MDEIDWIRNTKKALTVICISIVSIALAFMFLLIFSNFSDIIDSFENGISTDVLLMIVIPLGMAVGFILILLLGFGILYIIYKIMYAGQKTLNLDKNYMRDLPKKYTPAIASLVHDLKIDVYRDYTALILNLYCKKIIQIKKEYETYKFKEINTDLSGLENHEKYVLDCITYREKFDENIFKSLIIEDAQKSNLLSNKKSKRILRIMLILLCSIGILIGSYLLNKILFYVAFVLIGTILYTIYIVLSTFNQYGIKIVDTLYRRTNHGNHVAREISAFKNFIHEYTLIKDKPISYIQLLDEYIPYAIALNEATMIDDYIKNNEEYRSLIYQRF